MAATVVGSIHAEIEFLDRLPIYETKKPFVAMVDGENDHFIDNGDERLSNLSFTKQPVQVKDLRAKSDWDMNVSGFAPFAMPYTEPFQLEDGWVQRYRAQTEAVLTQHFGAYDVLCYDFKYRTTEPLNQDKVNLNDPLGAEGLPVGAHDLSLNYAPEILRTILHAHGKTECLRPDSRIRVVNTWRPVSTSAERRPLAMCDYRSLNVNDVIVAQRVYPHRKNEFYFLHHNESQQWYSISAQGPDEGVLMLMYDTNPGEGARFCAHTSFINPIAGYNAPHRESVETRCIVVTR